MEKEPMLVVDGNRGIYAAKAMFLFLLSIDKNTVEDLPYWAYKALEQGPNDDDYFDACEEMEELTFVIDGQKYNPCQNGDYWLVPVGYEGPEE